MTFETEQPDPSTSSSTPTSGQTVPSPPPTPPTAAPLPEGAIPASPELPVSDREFHDGETILLRAIVSSAKDRGNYILSVAGHRVTVGHHDLISAVQSA